jgi:hypothetical protein
MRTMALLRSDEADVRAARIRRPHEHRLLTGVAGAPRRCGQAVLDHEARRRAHAARAIEHLEVVVLKERDGVVRAAGGVGAAGMDVEPMRVNASMPCASFETQIMTWSIRVSIAPPLDVGRSGRGLPQGDA